MEKLRECPFCGEKAEIMTYKDDRVAVGRNGHCNMISEFATAEVSAMRWNTRAAIPSAEPTTGEAEDLELIRELEQALRAAHYFIINGIELGFIRMPDDSTPDTAHEVPKLISDAREKANRRLAEVKGE